MSVPRRTGFTLVELLVAVVIVGVLAAIATPKFVSTKGKANAGAMRSDLHNIAIAEETYLYEHGTYTNDATLLSFTPSPGVQIVSLAASANGWAAKVTHAQAYPMTCALFVGGIAAVSPATSDGVVACN